MESISRRTMIRSVTFTIGGLIHARPTSAASPPSPVGHNGGWLPLDLSTSRVLVVPAAINGRPLPAMIDSGASHSVISQQLALDLNMAALGPISTQSFTDRVNGSRYRAKTSELGGFTFRGIRFDSFNTRGSKTLQGTVTS